MSLPPQQIRVKRKRPEDTPVTYLQFDSSSKRRRGESNASYAWVYKRRDPQVSAAGSDSNIGPLPPRPIIRSSKPGDEVRVRVAPTSEKHALADTVSPPTSNDNRSPSLVSQRRRYHISRTALASGFKAGRSSSVLSGDIGHHGPIFVERRRLPATRTGHEQDQTKPVDAGMDGSRGTTPPPHGRGSKTPGILPSPNRSHRPLPFVDPSTQKLDSIAASMNAWVLEEMSFNMKNDTTDKFLRKPLSRFRPKAPAQRYAERHPEMAGTGSTLYTPTHRRTENRADATDDEDDLDSECIYDTYERVPAGRFKSAHDLQDIGVLVLENEHEAEYFYWQDETSDEDETDEEDENAETHYTADYPEDEVDSDDEYNIAAYKYRNANASDEEEYFGDGGLDTDQDDDEQGHEGDLEEGMAKTKIRRFIQSLQDSNHR